MKTDDKRANGFVGQNILHMKPGSEVEQITLKQYLMQCTCPAFGPKCEKTEITFTWLQQKTVT